MGKPNDFPGNIKPIKVINYKNGESAIYIVEGFELSEEGIKKPVSAGEDSGLYFR